MPPVIGFVIVTTGALPAATVTLILASVKLPTSSVARARSENVPGVVGVQVAVYGKVPSAERAVPFTKNCTPTTEPVVETAVALMVVGVLTATVLPLAGDAMATVGGVPPETVTVTGVEVAW